MWGGVAADGLKKVFNVNIINLKKMDKPGGGVRQSGWFKQIQINKHLFKYILALLLNI